MSGTTVLDVTSWAPAEDEFLGTKPKMWLYAPGAEGDEAPRWLWKAATTNRDRRRGDFLKGDDWAEVVASRVGVALGVPVAEVHLASKDEQTGIVSRSFLQPDETLVHGDELLAEVAHDPSALAREIFTLENVAGALDRCRPPGEHHVLRTALDWFAGFLILDALVGNTDRHEQNWGAIESGSGVRRLAPSFDHASCLGFMLHDDVRAEYLGAIGPGRSVAEYAGRARPKMQGFVTLVDAAVTTLGRTDLSVQRWWREAVSRVDALDPFLADLPQDRLTPAAAQFAAALYRQNPSVSASGETSSSLI